MNTKATYIGVFVLFVIACLIGVVLYRTLSEDNLLLLPYAQLPASSTVVIPEARSRLTIDRLFSTSTAADSFAKTVQIAQVGVAASFFDFRVTGEPVRVSKITFTMKPVLERELHAESVRRIVVTRDGLDNEYSETSDRQCNASECRFAVLTDKLFSTYPVTYASPVVLKLAVDVDSPGIASLADAFQFVIAKAGDVEAVTVNDDLVTIENNGATVAALHIVPSSVRVVSSWPLEPTVSAVSSSLQIGTVEVFNDGDLPVAIDSAVFEISSEAAGKVYYSLYASEDGSNPNDVSVQYVSGKRTGVFGRLSSVKESDRLIKPKSWRYLTVFAIGDVRASDVFAVRVADIGNIRFSVRETDLGYSGNPMEDDDLEDTISGLLTSGTPRLGRITIR